MKTQEEILELAKSYLSKAYGYMEQSLSNSSNKTYNEMYRSYMERFETLAFILDERPWDLHQKLTGTVRGSKETCAMRLARISHLTTSTCSGMILEPKEKSQL